MANKTGNTSSKGGVIAKAIAVIIAAVAVAYISVSAALSTWNPLKWKAARQTLTTTTDGNDQSGNTTNGGLTNGGGVLNETESNGMELSKQIIADSDYALYSVSETTETAYLLNVTVLPDNAFDKRVRGAVGWENSSSTWANGKDVSEYVTITQSESNEFQFVLSVLQPFGEPVTATVISVNDVNVKCTCKVDYLKTLDFDKTVCEINPELKAIGDNRRAYVGNKENKLEISPVYSVGTVAGDIKLTRVMFTPTTQTVQGINSALTSASVNNSSCRAATAVYGKLTGNASFTVPVDFFLDYGASPSAADLQRWQSITNNYLYDNGQNTVTYNCSYNKVTYRVSYTFGEDYSVTYNKTVDNGTYIFNPSGLTRIASISSITPDKDNITVLPN